MAATPTPAINEMFAGVANGAGLASTWSSCYAPGGDPGQTLKGPFTPGYTPPELPQKIMAFPNAPVANADYSIVAKLGEGGMGVVFEARQNHLNRHVALKMIRPERIADPLARNCFFYEAVITAGLEHPGIVPILEFGRAQDGRDFYVMKKATGVPWSTVVRAKTLEENLAIFDRVADVVAYAHAQGVIHRDIKPANVLLGDFGEVWLADWGVAVARNAEGDYRHAHPGGTPRYMAPEMARCDLAQIGPASDIYLLGAVLFEIVSGGPPHAGDAVIPVLDNASRNIIGNVSIAGKSLQSVVEKALATRPGHRYRSVQEMQAAIHQARTEDGSRTMLNRAAKNLAKAQETGEYDHYRQAIAEYNAVLDANPESAKGKQGRLKAVLAYAGEAVDNEEYDLALSIVESEGTDSKAGAKLIEEIEAEKEKVIRFHRRRAVVNALLGVFIVALLGMGAYIFRNRYDFAAEFYATPQEQAKVYSSVVGLQNTLRGMYRLSDSSQEWLRRAGMVKAGDEFGELSKELGSCLKLFDDGHLNSPMKARRIRTALQQKVPDLGKKIAGLESIMNEITDEALGKAVGNAYSQIFKDFKALNLALQHVLPWMEK